MHDITSLYPDFVTTAMVEYKYVFVYKIASLVFTRFCPYGYKLVFIHFHFKPTFFIYFFLLNIRLGLTNGH